MMTALVISNEGVHGVFANKVDAEKYCNVVKQTYEEAKVKEYALQ